MGTQWSKAIHGTPDYPVGDEMQELFESLGFTVYDMNNIYYALLDKSGAINVYEFLEYFELTKTEFSRKTFNLMDKDGSGQVDFEEFVLALWNFCSFTQESLTRYSFSLYDSDGSGEIDLNEAEYFVQEMWGGKWHTNKNAEHIMNKLTAIATASDGCIPIEKFVHFAHDNPLMMFPAFQIQHDMMDKILGEHFWTKIADQRQKNQRTDSKFKCIEDILQGFNANHAVLRQVKDVLSETSTRSQRFSFAESFRSKVGALSQRHKYAKKPPPDTPPVVVQVKKKHKKKPNQGKMMAVPATKPLVQ
ncbi:hypothetical protein H257_05580 [Aphanomyces astaci]|uniref:EF-hand domain-containing protein n=1 Tax=Aphanomyces astaci TaxID=112090 RepID=W4GQV3_APHAT|nr:hypothetical protein H257_05580 [Aphanomyces astaci]ETV82062.1 hypothetical protein H257_05580 [Aphanomyces astaci]|eukprot:XP_009828799.1 hypothetical protein H257_05580 [Aphanomyces astaci]